MSDPLPILMSKSQATQIAAALRRAARSDADGLVTVGYRPQHGIVVAIVKHGRIVETVHETGALKLPDYGQDEQE